MREIRDLLKKIGATEGTFCVNMDTKRREMTRTQKKQKRLKRCDKDTQKNYNNNNKKCLNDSVTTMVWSLTQSQTSQSALRSITMTKASGGYGIPSKVFQIRKDDAAKVLHSICQQIWKTQQWPWEWKRAVFILIPMKAIPKNVQATIQLYSFHKLARLCLKSFKPCFSNT